MLLLPDHKIRWMQVHLVQRQTEHHQLASYGPQERLVLLHLEQKFLTMQLAALPKTG